MKYAIESAMRKAYDILYSTSFMEQHRMSNKDFTRNRKLGFAEVCLLVIGGMIHGVSDGIRTFLKDVKNGVTEYSNASFSEARRKISPEAFRELYRMTVDDFYSTVAFKTFRGYRLCAIDGSRINLPNTPELLELYGSQPYGQGTVKVQALLSCLYDVLNNVVIDASFNPCKSNERSLACRHFEFLDSCRTEKELILMDRGYPSAELISKLEQYGYSYVMRVNRQNFFREVRLAEGDDVIIERRENDGTLLRFRRIEIQLSENTTETLITNIFDESFTIADFRELYSKRWNIETNYDTLKNKLWLEKFSGKTNQCILQDLYADLFLLNLLAYVEVDSQEAIREINESKQRKYEYQLNISKTIGELRKNVVQLVLCSRRRKSKQLLKKIHSDLANCLLPVRPGRSFPRA